MTAPPSMSTYRDRQLGEKQTKNFETNPFQKSKSVLVLSV